MGYIKKYKIHKISCAEFPDLVQESQHSLWYVNLSRSSCFRWIYLKVVDTWGIFSDLYVIKTAQHIFRLQIEKCWVIS